MNIKRHLNSVDFSKLIFSEIIYLESIFIFSIVSFSNSLLILLLDMASIRQMSLGVSSIVEVSVNIILTSSRIANRVHVYDWTAE